MADEKKVLSAEDRAKATNLLMQTKDFLQAIDSIAKLPADWLGHMLMLHGFIHKDVISAAASIKATEWLNVNRPEGSDEMPEVAGCLAANVMLWTGMGVTELAKLSASEWASYVEQSMNGQDITDATAEKYIEEQRAIMATDAAKSGFVLANADWDKTVH